MKLDELLGIVRTPSFSDDSLRAAMQSYGAAQRRRCEAVIEAFPHWIGPQAKAELRAAIRALGDSE